MKDCFGCTMNELMIDSKSGWVVHEKHETIMNCMSIIIWTFLAFLPKVEVNQWILCISGPISVFILDHKIYSEHNNGTEFYDEGRYFYNLLLPRIAWCSNLFSSLCTFYRCWRIVYFSLGMTQYECYIKRILRENFSSFL